MKSSKGDANVVETIAEDTRAQRKLFGGKKEIIIRTALIMTAAVLVFLIAYYYPIQKAIGNGKVKSYLETKGESAQVYEIKETYTSKIGGYNYFVTYSDEPNVRYISHYKYCKEVSIDDVEYYNAETKEFYNLGEMTSAEQAKKFGHLTDGEVADWFDN